jgi:hypothetical protein
MFDRRPQSQERADKAATSAFIKDLRISKNTQDGIVAAFKSPDSSYTLIVGVGTSELDDGAKHLVIECHGAETRSQIPGSSNWRAQFQLSGEHFGMDDPTFRGFADFATKSWKPLFDEIRSGKLLKISIEGLEFFPAPLT